MRSNRKGGNGIEWSLVQVGPTPRQTLTQGATNTGGAQSTPPDADADKLSALPVHVGDVLVLPQASRLVAMGLALGLLGATAVTRVLKTFPFQVEPMDPLTLVSVSLFLAAVVLLACYLPARRAARIDPMTALRYE